MALFALLGPARGFAASCTLQGQMTDDTRNELLHAARRIALAVQSGNTAAVKALTIPAVAAQFDSIAQSIQQVAPLISNASMTIDVMYGLDASDLRAPQDVQFFCSSTDSELHEEITIPGLPPGNYALAFVHATGVAQPQQFAFLMQKDKEWQLAGYFVRPLLVAGHDSVWYWSKARDFARKGQKWNAHFYYQTAVYLSAPVDLLSTPNLEKLKTEQDAVQADGLPGEQPLVLKAGAESFSITEMHPDGSLGDLDLALHYSAADTSDPVKARANILDLMKALLSQRPELREGFHGLWVFADSPGHQPFAIEQPMSAIP
jgi:hypothetical protein